MANSRSGESVLTRIVRILSAFEQGSRSLGVRELAERVSLPVSTAHRLLTELEAEGLVVRDGQGQWRHGHRLWEIALRGSDAQLLREAALPAMEEVALRLNVNVSLSILDRNEVLYIERLTPSDDTIDITQIAGRLPVHATSAGLVLVTFGTKEQRELLLRRRLEKYTDSTLTNPTELKNLLDRIRRDGFVASSGNITPDSTGVSVPIMGPDGEAMAALTVIVPVKQENLEVMVPYLMSAARETSRRLGHQPSPKTLMRISQPGPG